LRINSHLIRIGFKGLYIDSQVQRTGAHGIDGGNQCLIIDYDVLVVPVDVMQVCSDGLDGLDGLDIGCIDMLYQWWGCGTSSAGKVYYLTTYSILIQ
jgi:hypothetical protein